MGIHRREFVNMLAASLGAAAVGSSQKTEGQAATSARRCRAIVFDGFVIFDPRPVAQRVEEHFPGRGAEFASLWRTRQFEYAWLRTIGDRYADFWQVTEDALRYTAESMQLALSDEQRDRLMRSYRALPPWPDVPEGLAELRRRGIRLAFLSNFTAGMLDANLQAAKLEDFFEPHLSTDRVRAYKPSARAYQMGPDVMGLRREEITFAAFAGWDAAGAKWFGYPTVWVNRAKASLEELGARPDATAHDLSGLLKFVDEQQ